MFWSFRTQQLLFITIELNSQVVKSKYDDNSREGFIYLFTYSPFRTELCLQLNCIERELLNNSLILQPPKKIKKIKIPFISYARGCIEHLSAVWAFWFVHLFICFSIILIGNETQMRNWESGGSAYLILTFNRSKKLERKHFFFILNTNLAFREV